MSLLNYDGFVRESADTEVLDEVEVENGTTNQNVLVLYNDDVNSFEHVVDSLVKVCKHSQEQAYQCAMIAHYKKKCDIKEGEFDYLLGLKRALNKLGITADVE